MIVKTKKYQLATKKYIKMGLVNAIKDQWWVILIALAIAGGTIFIPTTPWFVIGAVLAYGLYVLFWYIQFVGVTQLDQNKIMFNKMNYEINSQHIMMKLSSKQGMPIKWDQIKSAKVGKDNIMLIISKGQFIYLPNKVFNTENDRKFVETILKRKGFLKQPAN